MSAQPGTGDDGYLAGASSCATLLEYDAPYGASAELAWRSVELGWTAGVRIVFPLASQWY